jgi:hypothetical protein
MDVIDDLAFPLPLRMMADLPYAAWSVTLLITAKRPNAKPATGNAANARKTIHYAPH